MKKFTDKFSDKHPEDQKKYKKPKALKPGEKKPESDRHSRATRSRTLESPDEDRELGRSVHLNAPSMACGGKVKSTGLYRLHKGEMVLPKDVVNKIKNLKVK